MFYVHLDLETVTLSGLAALDLRRVLGLSDGAVLSFVDGRITCTAVPESFARAHFNRTENNVSRLVPVSLLSRGDVMEDGSRIVFSEITPERTRELWLSGKPYPVSE